MSATVIRLYPGHGGARGHADLVRAARGDLSREEFAVVLSAALPWAAKPGMVRAWESGVPVPPEVVAACRADALWNSTAAETATASCAELMTPDGDGAADAIVVPLRTDDGRVM